MRSDVRALLYDIQNAIFRIEKYVAGMNYADYEKNEMARDAVERNFIIVGEAIRRMRLLESHIVERIQK